MPEINSPRTESVAISRILQRHFFRRFFDNDTVSIEGETQTTVVRALCAVAVPALMVAFWLLPDYPLRDRWSKVSDQYFFVLYSFVAMGVVTTFEWEMLFPDRADFLILLPLGLKARQLFYSKGKALLSFLCMFLVAANLFASIFFPAVSTPRRGNYWHAIYAHGVAVTLSGVFAAFAILAIEGLSMCLLPARWFRAAATILQLLSITFLLVTLLLYPLVGGHLDLLLVGQSSFAGLLPPLWFIGLYQYLLLGTSAPSACAHLAVEGASATVIVIVLALLTYPLAWRRQQVRALEGTVEVRKHAGNLVSGLLRKTLLRRPQQRGIFHFTTQTISRNPRYQVYLAIYAGIGLAMALCCIVTFRLQPNHMLSLAISKSGVHALLPLLLFWIIVGLRSAFAFPADMLARWVFPINLPIPGRDAKAAKLWVQLCCAALLVFVLGLLIWLGWSALELTIQAVCGICLAVILTDLFFLGRISIPFTRPRLPGRGSLPLVLTLYAALFPALVLLTVRLELAAEARSIILLWIVFWTIFLHIVLKTGDHLAEKGIIGALPDEDGDQGPQTLGLFQ